MEAWKIWAHLLQQEKTLIDNEPTLADHMRPAMLLLAAVLVIGLSVRLCSPPTTEPTWYERYIEENCSRCEREGTPCCVTIGAPR